MRPRSRSTPRHSIFDSSEKGASPALGPPELAIRQIRRKWRRSPFSSLVQPRQMLDDFGHWTYVACLREGQKAALPRSRGICALSEPPDETQQKVQESCERSGVRDSRPRSCVDPNISNSHKVYYGIFISIGITETCRKILRSHGKTNASGRQLRLRPDRQISTGREAAIDVENVPGDEAGFGVVEQKQRRARNLVRRCVAQPMPAGIDQAADRSETGLAQPSRPAMTLASLATSITTHLVALARTGSSWARAASSGPGARSAITELPAIAERGLRNRQPDTGSASGHGCDAAIGHDGPPSLVHRPVFSAGLVAVASHEIDRHKS